MHTKKQLLSINKADLIIMLAGLAEQLGEELSEDGNKEAVVQRILDAEQKLAAQGSTNQEDAGEQDGTTNGKDSVDAPGADRADKTTPDTRPVFVKAVPKAGFYRCGKFIPHEGAEFQLTQAEYERMEDDHNLVVELQA